MDTSYTSLLTLKDEIFSTYITEEEFWDFYKNTDELIENNDELKKYASDSRSELDNPERYNTFAELNKFLSTFLGYKIFTVSNINNLIQVVKCAQNSLDINFAYELGNELDNVIDSIFACIELYYLNNKDRLEKAKKKKRKEYNSEIEYEEANAEIKLYKDYLKIKKNRTNIHIAGNGLNYFLFEKARKELDVLTPYSLAFLIPCLKYVINDLCQKNNKNNTKIIEDNEKQKAIEKFMQLNDTYGPIFIDLLNGLKLKEIAKKRGYTYDTVKQYAPNINRHFDVATKKELVSKFAKYKDEFKF